MKHIKLNLDDAFGFFSKKEFAAYKVKTEKKLSALINKTGKGNEFLGWVDLPAQISDKNLSQIEKTAAFFQKNVEVVVLIGIGGSYLGARAVNEALGNSFDAIDKDRKNPLILYAGHNVNEDYLSELLETLEDISFGICVISKSGTTTEPAIAFRLLKKKLEEKVGKKKAAERIVAVTDASKGALRTLADREGYHTFVIPDNIGGRYSVLTPVGLLPIAIAGNNIRELVKGAAKMQKKLATAYFEDNIACQYAAARNILYLKGKKIEILANYHPKLHYISEWWKQLYAESEGKKYKGIYTSSLDFTTDLHSLGQYIQDGERHAFETILSVEQANRCVFIPADAKNLDGLNYLSGKHVEHVNKMAELGTRQAHVDGGVPNIIIQIPKLNEHYLGELIYFFELACGISGYLLDINPFNQPGVEAYKKNMFRLLGKK